MKTIYFEVNVIIKYTLSLCAAKLLLVSVEKFQLCRVALKTVHLI